MKATLKSVAESVDTLKTGVDVVTTSLDTFKANVDAKFQQVDARLEQIDRRFDSIEEWIAAEGAGVRRYFDERIQGAVDDMRRYFEMVAEQMKAERNLVLDGGLAAGQEVDRLRTANVAEHLRFEKTLADHEARLRRLESS